MVLGTLTSKTKLVDILDKGKGALVILDVVTFDERNAPVCTNQFSLYIRGIGGFGGLGSNESIKVCRQTS